MPIPTRLSMRSNARSFASGPADSLKMAIGGVKRAYEALYDANAEAGDVVVFLKNASKGLTDAVQQKAVSALSQKALKVEADILALYRLMQQMQSDVAKIAKTVK